MLLRNIYMTFSRPVLRDTLRTTGIINTYTKQSTPNTADNDEYNFCKEDVVTIKKKEVKKDETSSDDGGDKEKKPTYVERPEFPGKVRLGFIPEEWFQFFYPKTGVTGPYVFGLGLITYLCSKEIYVMEHEYYSGLSLAIMIIYGVKKWGPMLAEWCDKKLDKNEAEWAEMHKNDIERLEKEMEEEKLEQWRAEGALLLCQAKKEQINMQLEAAYRQAAMEVHQQVENLLNYQVECRNIERRVAHKHMIFWVQEQMLKELGAAESAEELEKRKADISALVMRVNDILTDISYDIKRADKI